LSDLKTNTRRRARKKKDDVNGSASAKEKPLNDIERRILNVLSTVVTDGAPNVPEPGLNIVRRRIINLVGDIEAERSDNEGIQKY
jgi:hypothetical protein